MAPSNLLKLLQAVANIFGIIAGIVALTDLIRPNTVVTTNLVIAIAVLLLTTFIVYFNRVQKWWRDYLERLRGPDHEHQHLVTGTLEIGAQAIFRSAWRLTKNRDLPLLAPILLFGIGYWSLLWFFDSRINAGEISMFSGLIPATLTSGSLVVCAFILTRITILVRKSRRSSDSKNKTRSEIMEALDSEYLDKSNRELRAKIITEDSGPFIIIPATGADLLTDPKKESDSKHDLFSRVWEGKDKSKTFRILLTDPTCELIRDRNKHLNGRYLQYYVIPYLKMLLRSQHESKIELFRWNELTHRLVMSQERVVIQRYAEAKHGWKDDAVVLHRVFTKKDIETFQNDFDEFRRSHKESDTIYSKYYSIAETNMKPGSAVKETTLESWGTEKLCALARDCHIDKNLVKELSDDNTGLVRLIYKKLELSDYPVPCADTGYSTAGGE